MAATSSNNMIPNGTYTIKSVKHSVGGGEDMEVVQFKAHDVVQGLHVPKGRYYPEDRVRVENDKIVEKVRHARDRRRDAESHR